MVRTLLISHIEKESWFINSTFASGFQWVSEFDCAGRSLHSKGCVRLVWWS